MMKWQLTWCGNTPFTDRLSGDELAWEAYERMTQPGLWEEVGFTWEGYM